MLPHGPQAYVHPGLAFMRSLRPQYSHTAYGLTEPGAAHNEGRAGLRGDLDVMLAALMCELDRWA
jgi:hypothetical protein